MRCHERDLRRMAGNLPKFFKGKEDETGEDGPSDGDEGPLPWALTLPRGVLVGRGRYWRYLSEKGSVNGRRYLNMVRPNTPFAGKYAVG